MSVDDYGGWPALLGKMTAGEHLGREEAGAAMAAVLAGEASAAQIAGFMIALRMKGESTDELVGLLGAMRAAADRVPVDAAALRLVDTCGTGGDRSHSINVSTIAAMVAAGAGARVAKHGNRSASSACGSADLLEALGVAIELGPDGVARCIERAGIGFCFAPRFHSAMRHAGPPRRELGVPTIFNFLGPMANPAGVLRQVVGISDPAMAERMVEVLKELGSEHAFIVHGDDGLDELSISAPSSVWELRGGELRQWRVDPTDFGIELVGAEAVRGADPATNADHARRILDATPGPHRDFVVLNAGAALVVAGLADELAAGVELARSVLDEGRAGEALEALVTASQAEAG